MNFSTLKLAGSEALERLQSRRLAYPTSGEYPFLIGDAEELEHLVEAAEFDERCSDEIIRQSQLVDLDAWIRRRRSDAEEYGFSAEDILGEWPSDASDKGSISLYKDITTGRILPDVYLGLAAVEQPWQLPAVVKNGGWNECPHAEVHCAFYRKWQAEFGAQIAGISGDVIECVVNNPPLDRATAIDLAWQQYWYCADIVDQGCGSISNLAATLLDSPYWFFWWD